MSGEPLIAEKKPLNVIKIKQTANSRHERIEALKTLMAEKKKLPIAEVYKYALNTFGIGIRTIDLYLHELSYMGWVKLILNDYDQIKAVEVVEAAQ